MAKFEEKRNTAPGKRHPMPSPDQYMKELYRANRFETHRAIPDDHMILIDDMLPGD